MSERIRPAERDKYIQQIAGINDLRRSDVSTDELRYHYDITQQGYFDSSIIGKYIDLGLSYHDHRRYTERMNLLIQLAEGLLEEDTKFTSYGIFLPSYLAALEDYKHAHGNTEDHRALMIGAQTINSIDEYAFALRSVFRNPKAGVIDLEGRDTVEAARQQGFFAFANATNLPFKPGTFDSIHTNVLLPHMEEVRSEEHGRREFFKQSHYALKPGGILLMAEVDYDEDIVQFNALMTQELLEAGFSRVSSTPAMKLAKRYFVDRIMSGEVLPPTAAVPSDRTILFVAQK